MHDIYTSREDNINVFNLIRNRKWDEIYDIIDKNKNFDVNMRDRNNIYLINYAINNNQIKIVELLVNRKAKLDMLDNEGRSILFIPIKYEYDDIIDLLIEHNRDIIGISIVNIKDFNGNIPINYAIKFGNSKIFKKIFDNKGKNDFFIYNNNGMNSLHIAIETKNIDFCEMIINFNKMIVDTKLSSGESTLQFACLFGEYQIVELLIKNSSNVDYQDTKYEYTALHYAINSGYNNIIKLLIDNNANINLQDFEGNTPLHFIINEKNIEIFKYIIENPKLNANLWNIKNELPLHLLLKSDIIYSELIELLIPKTDLNIQDIDGNTCLHLITKKGLWEKNKKILEDKKLNIFIKNNNYETPTDYVSKSDYDKYINLIAISYVNTLRNINNDWLHVWENLCKKELKSIKQIPKNEVKEFNLEHIKDNNDICVKITIKKIMKTLKLNDSDCKKTSIPKKKSSLCINVSEGEKMNFCTFTGSVLDNILWLYLLLKNHGNSCSVINDHFDENNISIENYFKSIGFEYSKKYHFLNTELLWTKNKLYFINNFDILFKKCIENKKKRFIIIPLGIILKNGAHLNYLIYDRKVNEIERFEPHGASFPLGFNYFSDILDENLKNHFEDIKYVSPKDYLPRIGFQKMEFMEQTKVRIGDPEGLCAAISTWYVDMRLTYSDFTREKLVKKLIKYIKSNHISIKNMIRNYTKDILNERDNLLAKYELDINDWMNETIDDNKLDAIINEIKEKMRSVN